jgi:hypothetical protein
MNKIKKNDKKHEKRKKLKQIKYWEKDLKFLQKL